MLVSRAVSSAIVRRADVTLWYDNAPTTPPRGDSGPGDHSCFKDFKSPKNLVSNQVRLALWPPRSGWLRPRNTPTTFCKTWLTPFWQPGKGVCYLQYKRQVQNGEPASLAANWAYAKSYRLFRLPPVGVIQSLDKRLCRWLSRLRAQINPTRLPPDRHP